MHLLDFTRRQAKAGQVIHRFQAAQRLNIRNRKLRFDFHIAPVKVG